MADKCVWTGASGRKYSFSVYARHPRIIKGQMGGYIYAKIDQNTKRRRCRNIPLARRPRIQDLPPGLDCEAQGEIAFWPSSSCFASAAVRRREITRGHSTLPLADCSQSGHRPADMPPASLVPETCEYIRRP